MPERILHDSTGRDCSSQRLFPSKDTEGAVIKFMEARLQSTMHNRKGTLSGVSAKMAFSTANSSPPFHSTATPQTGIRKVPRPQLSI